SRKHASKVRLYYMLHPLDGGCPAKKLRSENGNDEDSVDKNKCCTLCNMSFTSAVVAESHYQGKIHAKRLKLLLGEQPAIKATETNLSSLKQPHMDSSPVVSLPHQRRDSDRYCQLCAAWFNNPMMAQQHYDGKKHKKNAARADLLEQLGKTLDLGELRGLKRSYTCNICNVTLNSIEQYHAHLKGSKHQTNGSIARTRLVLSRIHISAKQNKYPQDGPRNYPKAETRAASAHSDALMQMIPLCHERLWAKMWLKLSFDLP
ncbi:hypothetical protein JRQ81_011115, partial [Phrynocephalus forsythii]